MTPEERQAVIEEENIIVSRRTDILSLRLEEWSREGSSSREECLAEAAHALSVLASGLEELADDEAEGSRKQILLRRLMLTARGT